jgi:hypothetical protein
VVIITMTELHSSKKLCRPGRLVGGGAIHPDACHHPAGRNVSGRYANLAFSGAGFALFAIGGYFGIAGVIVLG